MEQEPQRSLALEAESSGPSAVVVQLTISARSPSYPPILLCFLFCAGLD